MTLIERPRQSKTLCGISNGYNMAVRIFRNIGHGTAVFQAILLGFTQGAHHYGIYCILPSVSNDLDIRRTTSYGIYIIREVAKTFSIFGFQRFEGFGFHLGTKKRLPVRFSFRNVFVYNMSGVFMR